MSGASHLARGVAHALAGVAAGSRTVSAMRPDLNQNFRPPWSSFEVLLKGWDEVAAPATPPPPDLLTARLDVASPFQPDSAGTTPVGFAAFVAGAGLPGAAVSDPDAILQTLGAASRGRRPGCARPWRRERPSRASSGSSRQ